MKIFLKISKKCSKMGESDRFKNITVVKPTNISEIGEDPNSLSQEALAYEQVEELKASYKRKEGSVPIALLNEVQNRKRQICKFVKMFAWVLRFVYNMLVMFLFCFSKFIVSVHKN